MRRPIFILLCAASMALLAGCGQPDDPTPTRPDDGPTSSAASWEDPVDSSQVIPATDPVVPMRDAVDDSWFSNTAMIGHSLMEGMRANSGLDTPDYYTLTGASVSVLLSSNAVHLPNGGYGSLDQALDGTDYEHVYLFMGINEVSGDLDALKRDYLELVELVRSHAPNADIYVLAVLPVTKSKAAEGTFTVERITAYNEMLQTLCAQQGCWYVDVYSFYADAEGYLPSSASQDGVHLYAGEYPELLRYIKRHTAEAG